MALPDAISRALSNAKRLREQSAANEANTKALLIEPLLAALGWDPGDFDSVGREIQVFEGTYLDYALKLDGRPRVYVEAKGLNERLDDRKFVAQTVNYANNDGVVWCVLTNGLRIRVFKTNEPAAMDRKLLFEVDLSDESEPVADKMKWLRLISREGVEAGDLDTYGDRVFTDGRVRQALATLAADPPDALLAALEREMGHPTVPTEVLQRSLARILESPVAPTAPAPNSRSRMKDETERQGPPAPPKGQEYPLEHHLGNKGALIQEIFSEINAFASALGGDVTRRVRKQYVGYYRGKRSFITVELQQQRAIVYVSLDPSTARPWIPELMRDVTNIGHFGMGDIECSVRDVDQLDSFKELIQTAYERRG